MMKLFARVELMFLSTIATEGVGEVRAVVIYDGAVTKLATRSPLAHAKDLWVTFSELTRATGFVVKPQGVCRSELCFPKPKQKKGVERQALRAARNAGAQEETQLMEREQDILSQSHVALDEGEYASRSLLLPRMPGSLPGAIFVSQGIDTDSEQQKISQSSTTTAEESARFCLPRTRCTWSKTVAFTARGA